jgi:hypothetical protein
MPDLSSQYEKKLQQQILDFSRQVKSIYFNSINEISFFAAAVKQFNPDNSPLIRKKIEKILKQMHTSIETSITNSITQAWGLSNEKNDGIADKIIGEREFLAAAQGIIYNPNAGALVAFTKRKEEGMNLSDRVWNLVDPYKFELEAGLTDGIAKGVSAAKMATDLKMFLNEPDKLFRRVRDENGVLQLSKAAEAYHPGQGVYRSSFKNAFRLTATETNMAYRSSDFERWNNNRNIIGMEVIVSNNHPVFDQCDALAGKYPKEFKFRGWHPRCRCTSIPILATDEQISQMQDVRLGLAQDAPDVKYIDTIPAGAKKWIKGNADRINGWKNTPYWAKDNPQYVNALLGKQMPKAKVVPKISKVPKNDVINHIRRNNIASLKTLKRRGIDFPDEVLKLISKDIRIIDDVNSSGSKFIPGTNTLVIGGKDRTTNPYFQKKIVLHEGGHAIHFNKNIITLTHADPQFTSFYQKLQSVIKGKEGKLDDQLRDLGYKNRYDLTKKEQISMLRDTLGSLTSGKYGFGHKLSYYQNGNLSMMEVFAHSIELARLENEFQNIDPAIKELVDLMKEYGSNILK